MFSILITSFNCFHLTIRNNTNNKINQNKILNHINPFKNQTNIELFYNKM